MFLEERRVEDVQVQQAWTKAGVENSLMMILGWWIVRAHLLFIPSLSLQWPQQTAHIKFKMIPRNARKEITKNWEYTENTLRIQRDFFEKKNERKYRAQSGSQCYTWLTEHFVVASVTCFYPMHHSVVNPERDPRVSDIPWNIIEHVDHFLQRMLKLDYLYRLTWRWNSNMRQRRWLSWRMWKHELGMDGMLGLFHSVAMRPNCVPLFKIFSHTLRTCGWKRQLSLCSDTSLVGFAIQQWHRSLAFGVIQRHLHSVFFALRSLGCGRRCFVGATIEFAFAGIAVDWRAIS